MMILPDTSVWIDALRGTPEPAALMLAKAIEREEAVCICGFVLTEVLQGIKSDQDAWAFRSAAARMIYLRMPKSGYLLAADISRAARARGKTVRGTIDCLIAACAITNGVPILHKDRDFDTIAEVSRLKLVRI
jgi:predicted nucleic acid-binding protein